MAEATFAFDLHVLGTPPALILSQDQTLMLNVLSHHSGPKPAAAEQPFNARPIGWLCVVQSVPIVHGSPPAASSRIESSGRPILRRHALTLTVLAQAKPRKGQTQAMTRAVYVLARTI